MAKSGSGLATLTHTPSPMGFLNQLLGRPPHERPFLLLVAGYPEPGAERELLAGGAGELRGGGQQPVDGAS